MNLIVRSPEAFERFLELPEVKMAGKLFEIADLIGTSHDLIPRSQVKLAMWTDIGDKIAL